MDTQTNSSTRALVVHQDDKTDAKPAAHPANEIVLDALPYVEPLDPNYENYAIQLIEEELQHDAGDVSGEHPSLRTLFGRARGTNNNLSTSTELSSQCPQFGGKAPMAVAAYEAIVARKAALPRITFFVMGDRLAISIAVRTRRSGSPVSRAWRQDQVPHQWERYVCGRRPDISVVLVPGVCQPALVVAIRPFATHVRSVAP